MSSSGYMTLLIKIILVFGDWREIWELANVTSTSAFSILNTGQRDLEAELMDVKHN